MNTCALILAAGLSSRMGGKPKALCVLKDASFLEHCLQLFRAGGIGHCLIVTGHGGEAVRAEAGLLGEKLAGTTLHVVHNAQYKKGMFSSIQTGIGAVQALFPEARGSFLLPVDSPLVAPATITALSRHWRSLGNPESRILLPSYAGIPGHPPLIGREHFDRILAWPVTRGLREYMGELPGIRSPKEIKEDNRQEGSLAGPDTPLCFLHLQDPNIPFDIDTPAMLEQAQGREVPHLPWPLPPQ